MPDRYQAMVITQAGLGLRVGELLALRVEDVDFPPGPDGLLFTTPSGRPHWHEHYGTRLFQRAVGDAGLPLGTSTHDLRHHYASVLLAAGESVVAVAERRRHEDATLVLTTYGHLMPDSEHRTRRAIDEAWCAPAMPQAEQEAL